MVQMYGKNHNESLFFKLRGEDEEKIKKAEEEILIFLNEAKTKKERKKDNNNFRDRKKETNFLLEEERKKELKTILADFDAGSIQNGMKERIEVHTWFINLLQRLHKNKANHFSLPSSSLASIGPCPPNSSFFLEIYARNKVSKKERKKERLIFFFY